MRRRRPTRRWHIPPQAPEQLAACALASPHPKTVVKDEGIGSLDGHRQAWPLGDGVRAPNHPSVPSRPRRGLPSQHPQLSVEYSHGRVSRGHGQCAHAGCLPGSQIHCVDRVSVTHLGGKSSDYPESPVEDGGHRMNHCAGKVSPRLRMTGNLPTIDHIAGAVGQTATHRKRGVPADGGGHGPEGPGKSPRRSLDR